MLQSKLLGLFKHFSKEELDEFDKFLASPYFNQSEKLLKFFRLIAHYQPLFDSANLEKEKLYKALHGKGKYNDSTMRELISDLFKQAKQFLSYHEFRNDKLELSKLRFNWFRVHQIERLAEAEIENRTKLLADYTDRDNYYYHHRWILDLDIFDLDGNNTIGKEHLLLKDFAVFDHVHSLNRNYLVNCFIAYIYLLNLRGIYDFNLDDSFLQRLEADALPYIGKGDKLIDIFFNNFQLLRTNDEKYFFELKARFFENDISVGYLNMRDAGVTLQNFCTRKARDGDERFTREIMQIYRFEIENNLYLNNGLLSPVYFCNVAERGAEANELDWTEYFVENYHQYLPEGDQLNTYRYAHAHILFAREKYRDALRMALSSNITRFVTKILLRNLIARCQYELGMIDELRQELGNYKHHQKDEKLTEQRRNYFQVFATNLRLLIDLKENYTREKWARLSEQVELQKGSANRNWFQEKLTEIRAVSVRR
jgi:hypothetical protein